MKKELLHNFFEGTTSFEEEQRIKTWMESSEENKQAFFRERKAYDASIVVPPLNEFGKQKQTFRRRLWMKEYLKIASVILLTIALTQFYQRYQTFRMPIAMQTITVPAGQYISLNLPDGTQVWLNARTTLKYPVDFNQRQRTVELDGEAYFEVARKEKIPFTVKTEKYAVEVLGTKFNVEAYRDKGNFATTLMHGKVRIEPAEKRGTSLILKPDTKAVFENGKLVVHNVDDYNPYRWREGLICFKNESFSSIMSDFEKYYGMTIEIQNKGINKYNYTGKFRQTDGIDYALKVLQKDISFSFTRNDERQEITIK
ncbi:MAG: FecR domain-containing protein [Massilibacteroides sp.]|nr:FecR domain-containing protein [Massilibacteroides sp.]